MKKILLASVALTAFAGAAAAEVSFSGDGAVGHVSDNGTAANNGMYWNADLNVAFSQELDNGITATAGMTFSFVDDNQGNAASVDALSVDDNWKVTLSSDMASLSFGDVEFAAVSAWKSAGTMVNDGFREIGDNGTNLKGSVTYGQVTAAVSYDADAGQDLGTADIGITADLGGATAVIAYQEGVTGGIDELLGVSVSTSMSGVDFTVAYASNETDNQDSTGLKVGYAFGDVKASAFFVSESVGEDGYGMTVDYTAGALKLQAFYEEVDNAGVAEEETRIQAQYDLGNGLVLTAGSIDGDDAADDDFASYLVAEYSLGGGASLMASYADGQAGGVGSTDIDTFGGYELNDGTTIELSFAF